MRAEGGEVSGYAKVDVKKNGYLGYGPSLDDM
jgi:hypothetical protein